MLRLVALGKGVRAAAGAVAVSAQGPAAHASRASVVSSAQSAVAHHAARFGFGAGQSLDHPNGIAVAPDSTVYVTDTGNGRLLVFDPSGDRVGTVSRGVAPGNLGLPVGVVFDDHGRIAVVDSTAATVQLYAPIEAGASGPAYIDRFGEQGNADAQLSFPNGLAADGRGRLYVADWGNDRLEIWSY